MKFGTFENKNRKSNPNEILKNFLALFKLFLFICFFLNWRKVKIFIKNVKRKGITTATTPRDKLR
jgi:hypothetical protein